MQKITIRSITVYRLSIPLRRMVSHAAARRHTADSIVVAVELSDATIGYGETLPRNYVTGETVESVVADIRGPMAKSLLDFHPTSFSEALEFIDALPWRDADGRLMSAARAAVELALLDGSMRRFDRGVDDMVAWLGLPGFGSPGSIQRIRYGGVLACDSVRTMMRQLRLMYWWGLRDFKLKVGGPDDDLRVNAVARYLRRPLACGKATLRLDANGAWTKDEAIERLGDWKDLSIACIEQPLARGDEVNVRVLRDLFDLDYLIVHDESLVTMADAERLISLGVAGGFNIRISKCGGLIPALRLARLARRGGARIQLGCMVGETSILSAAGVRFLEVCPDVRWAEGAYGSLLLAGDVSRRGLRFGFGGRPPRLCGRGLGVEVEESRLAAMCDGRPMVEHL